MRDKLSVIYEDNIPCIDHSHDHCTNDCDDKHSKISSENGNEGAQSIASQTLSQRQYLDRSLWDEKEVDETLNLLPGAFEIIRTVSSAQQLNLSSNAVNPSIALLLMSWYGCTEPIQTILSNSRADPNTTDPKGRTPLHFACSIGEHQIAKLLLDHGADPNRWDNDNKCTPLHCAASAGSVECIQLLLKRKAQINVGIEKRSALHYAINSNSLECAEILLKYGADPNTPQVFTETPLHTACALGHKECVALLLKHGADIRSLYGKNKLTALHLASESHSAGCVRLLLEHGAEVDKTDTDDQTPLHKACLSQCPGIVELLLSSGANVHAVYKGGKTALHAAVAKESKSQDCVRMILKAGIDINKADDSGYAPLHTAALNELAPCVSLLINSGADITARTNGRVPALSFIVRRTPEIIPKIISNLDACIQTDDGKLGDVDCQIKLDFRLLVPNTERCETDLLKTFIEVGQKRILNHPLCETFLFLKWRRIRKYFLLSLCYRAIYVLLFTFYVMGIYMQTCTANAPCHLTNFTRPLGYTVISLNSLLLLKELFQMAQGFYGYAKYWENWLQWIVVFGVFLCVTPETLSKNQYTLNVAVWQYHVAAIVIFLVWLELMMLIGRFPIFGLYVQMFTKVAMNFGKFIVAYFSLLMGFALAFCVLLPTYGAFTSVHNAVMKVIAMMAGELEFENVLIHYIPPYQGTAQIMFLAFILLVTIILTNLVVGLAVSDIQGLQESVGLDRLIRQADLVSRLESFFFSRLIQKIPKRCIMFWQRNALLRTSRHQLQFIIRPNDTRDRQLPEEMKMSIYKLVSERRDRNQSMKRRKREDNMNLFKSTVDIARNDSQKDEQVALRSQMQLNRRTKVLSDCPQNYLKMKEIHGGGLKGNESNSDIAKVNFQLAAVSEKLDNLTMALRKQLNALSEELEMFKVEQRQLRE